MEAHRKSAIIVGTLFIIATAFLFIGQAVYMPVLGSPDYLKIAYPNRTTISFGILLEFICVLAMPLLSVFLFPVLRKHNEAFALGYVGFRFLEATLFMIMEYNKLSLIGLSREYLDKGGEEAAFYQMTGAYIQSLNESAFTIYILVFCVGALMLYSTLYKSNLVPRFISAWGFLAAVLMLTGAALSMVEMLSGFPPAIVEMILILPIAVNEMVLAGWLIAKGFNPEAIGAAPAAAGQ